MARLLSGWGFTRSLNFNRKREAGRLKICLQVWDEFKSDGIPLLSWLLVTLELCSSEANLSGLFLSYFTVAKRRYTIQMCSHKCVHKTILLSKNYTYFNLRGYGLFRKKLSAPMGFVSTHSDWKLTSKAGLSTCIIKDFSENCIRLLILHVVTIKISNVSFRKSRSMVKTLVIFRIF